jgi:predicted RNase H-like HicB family nuclease
VTDNESIKAGERMQQGTEKSDDVISKSLPNIIRHGSSLTEANKLVKLT